MDRGGKLVHNNGRDRKKRFEDTAGVMAILFAKGSEGGKLSGGAELTNARYASRV